MRHKEFLAEVARTAPLEIFTPRLYRFFDDYLGVSPPRRFRSQYVVNNFIPPFPGKAFARFLETVFGNSESNTLIHGADLAVTNACPFNCYHCYNAYRAIRDLPADTWRRIIRDLCSLGAITLGISGGEPCLRGDLPQICGAIPDDCAGVLSTTGYNFTDELAGALRDTAVYAVCFSLDSADEGRHDRLRGRRGAFRVALEGIERSLRHGFYTYVCTVPTPSLLVRGNFEALVKVLDRLGVPEMQIIEPAPAGRLLTSASDDFGPADFDRVRQYMAEVNSRESGLVVTSFGHMESAETFGCGAGTSHIYVDGTGEVSPCNLLPVSYGNATKESLRAIVARMQERFATPCAGCLAHALNDFFRQHARGTLPVPADALPQIPRADCEGTLPAFFQILAGRENERAGAAELRNGYDQASETYDEYWLSIAGAPIDEMLAKMPPIPNGRALDCACGTGYTTEHVVRKVQPRGTVLAVDLSEGMIARARERLTASGGLDRVTFRVGDVLDELRAQREASLDAVTMTWLIGYVSCKDVFPLIRRALRRNGLVGFVAHLDRSPRIPIEVIESVIRDNPTAFEKYVQFSFPKNLAEVREHLARAGLKPLVLEEGTFNFRCGTGTDVYDHLMKSGAGTTFWLAVRPAQRERLKRTFIDRVEQRFRGCDLITIEHRYVLGIARPTGPKEGHR
jgi:MoaA/NifB/PqqE/SkfB family radical SAM enzyme/ubiquinone/menaquinone biosynthesis C-methylase UbiE